MLLYKLRKLRGTMQKRLDYAEGMVEILEANNHPEAKQKRMELELLRTRYLAACKDLEILEAGMR